MRLTAFNIEKAGHRYFYHDTFEGSFRRRWELFDVQRSDMPGFIFGRRKADGKIVSVRESQIEVEAIGQPIRKIIEPSAYPLAERKTA